MSGGVLPPLVRYDAGDVSAVGGVDADVDAGDAAAPRRRPGGRNESARGLP